MREIDDLLKRRPGLGTLAGEAEALRDRLARERRSSLAGSSAVCLQWGATRALAAGASKDEIADVLLAIAPVAGLGRVVSAAPDLATALEYDVEAALAELDDP